MIVIIIVFIMIIIMILITMFSTGPSRGCKSLVDQLGHSARQLASPREVTHSEMVMMFHIGDDVDDGCLDDGEEDKYGRLASLGEVIQS